LQHTLSADDAAVNDNTALSDHKNPRFKGHIGYVPSKYILPVLQGDKMLPVVFFCAILAYGRILIPDNCLAVALAMGFFVANGLHSYRILTFKLRARQHR